MSGRAAAGTLVGMTITAVQQQITVRHAHPEDGELAERVLTASFFDDPVTNWLVPDRSRRPAVMPPVFDLYVESFLPHGETYLTDDGSGVALWLQPGRELLGADQLEDFAQRVVEAAGPDAERIFQISEIFDAHAPAEPHWHLQLLGVHPDQQGRGVGSVLLTDQLRRLDRRGESAYLEATGLRNRALYERHGFVCTGRLELPDGPTLWQMWRTPKAPIG